MTDNFHEGRNAIELNVVPINVIQKRGMTQAEAAEFFGVTQPRISDLMRGKIDLFSLDTLMNMASTAGMSPVVKLSKPKALPVRRNIKNR